MTRRLHSMSHLTRDMLDLNAHLPIMRQMLQPMPTKSKLHHISWQTRGIWNLRIEFSQFSRIRQLRPTMGGLHCIWRQDGKMSKSPASLLSMTQERELKTIRGRAVASYNKVESGVFSHCSQV